MNAMISSWVGESLGRPKKLTALCVRILQFGLTFNWEEERGSSFYDKFYMF